MDNQKQSPISKLLKRMDSSPGFAGLGSSVRLISRLTEAEDGGTRELTETILCDAALTGKLLRISNSSRNARGGRNITTIDQAIVILGLNTVKSVALSLSMLDALSNKPQSKQLHAEIVAAYFCSSLAYEITRIKGSRYNTQEAQVCGLMQNIGRIMATYYLYDEIERSRSIQAEKNLTEEEAVAETLGMTYEDISVAIALHWNLPDLLQQCLAPKIGNVPPRGVASALAWHQYCSLFSRRITDALFRLPENREKIEINREIDFFRSALQLKDDETSEWIEKALDDTNYLLEGLTFPCDVEQARNLLRKASERVMDLLSSQDSLTQDNNKVEGKTPVEIIQQSLRQIHDTLSFDRTLLCVPDGSSGLRAIIGIGRNAVQITAKFRCQGPKPDIFRLVMSKKMDMFVVDTKAPNLAPVIPPWYSELVGARSFLLMSLVSDGQFLGMVYGDYAEFHPKSPQELNQESIRESRECLKKALQSAKPKT